MRAAVSASILALACLATSCRTPFFTTQPRPETPRITVLNRVITPIDRRLFGQFLERASWGEPGPEALVDPKTGLLPPRVTTLLQAMAIPVIRFPGGTDVDSIDWRDMISNVPDRAPERPVTTGHRGDPITNRFGLDEYFRLRDRLRCDTILVVNLMDAVTKRRPLEEMALRAAGLVAYCNAPAGTPLPAGMPDWPAVRAKNGHPDPYRVTHFQIGNETQAKVRRLLREPSSGFTSTVQVAAWYRDCVVAYADRMRQVDPSIQIILDGPNGSNDVVMLTVAQDPEIRRRVQYLTVHEYAPGPARVKRDGQPVDLATLTPSDHWNAWVSMPGQYAPDGTAIACRDQYRFLKQLGYRVATTEWNWNGYGQKRPDPTMPFNNDLASAIGTAGFLHGLIRSADLVDIACQSMLVGVNWDIAAIRATPAPDTIPWWGPQGQTTAFYNRFHGRFLVDSKTRRIPTCSVPIAYGWAARKDKVAALDPVITADGRRLFVHVINRLFDRDLPLELDLSAVRLLDTAAQHQWMTGRLLPDPAATEKSPCRLESAALTVINPVCRVTIPARTVNIIEFQAEGAWTARP